MVSMRRSVASIAVLLACLAAGACFSKKPGVRVGWGDSTESALLGEIAAARLQKVLGPRAVERRPALGGVQARHQAMLAAEADVSPEFTGSLFLEVLKQPIETEPLTVREQTREYMRYRYQIDWIGSLGFDNRAVVLVRRETAEALKISTLSSASTAGHGWVIASTPDYERSPAGRAALMRGYKLPMAAPWKAMPLAMLRRSLDQNQATMVVLNATDPETLDARWLTLEDGERALIPQEAGYAVRTEALARLPALGPALESLKGKLKLETVRQLVAEVERGRPAADVAAGFLSAAGL